MKNQKGFTLIELMIVVTILSLLATVSILRLGSHVDKAKTAVTGMTMLGLYNSLDVYRGDTGAYPTTIGGLASLLADDGNTGWAGPYLRTNKIPMDGWGTEFNYVSPPVAGQGFDYDLWSNGPDLTDDDGTGNDIANWE